MIFDELKDLAIRTDLISNQSERVRMRYKV